MSDPVSTQVCPRRSHTTLTEEPASMTRKSTPSRVAAGSPVTGRPSPETIVYASLRPPFS